MGPVKILVPESATTRLGIAVAAGILTAASGRWIPMTSGALLGLAVFGLVLVVLGWLALWPMDGAATKAHVSTRAKESPTLSEALIIGIPLAGLTSIVAFLTSGGSASDPWPAAMALVGVAMSWGALHMMYATRYALHYYGEGKSGGIDFNSDHEPSFRDFLYFSYNLGMTYAVSDNNITDPIIRSVVLRHALLAYVFGTAILATTINLVVGALT